MGILDFFFVFKKTWLVQGIFFPETIQNQLLGFAGRLRRNAGGIGTHIGDQTFGLAGSKIDSFVKLLSDYHGFASAEPELADGFLLQFTCGKRGQRIFAGGLFQDFVNDEFLAAQLL